MGCGIINICHNIKLIYQNKPLLRGEIHLKLHGFMFNLLRVKFMFINKISALGGGWVSSVTLLVLMGGAMWVYDMLYFK